MKTTLYYRNKGRAYQKVKGHLELLGVKFNEVCIGKRSEYLNEQTLINILEKAEDGFDSIIVRGKRGLEFMENMSTTSMIKYLIMYPDYLQQCFVIGEKAMVNGLNDIDEYTIFIPFHKREMSKYTW